MEFALFISGCAIFWAIVLLVKRWRLKKELRQLSDKIANIPPYNVNDTDENSKKIPKGKQSKNIIENIETAFCGRYVTFALKKSFIQYFQPLYLHAKKVVKKVKKSITLPQTVSEFLKNFEGINRHIDAHNDRHIRQILENNKEFFDKCLKYPLDDQQRRAIVSEEENCLVVSGAGSGKTSSIVGKVKYLIEILKINPDHILLISFTRKSAAELTERTGVQGLRGYTFHKLALDIIAKHTGQKPSICDNTDAVLIDIYHELLKTRHFRRHIIEYFAEYQDEGTDAEKEEREKKQKWAEQKSSVFKAILPDMDGNAICVRSQQEKSICFALSSLGVNFRYEEPYEHPVADGMHSQYKPDFSIHYKENGEEKRLYLEHFGINERGLVPSWFAEDRNMSYTEANQRYNDGITWKRATHEKYGTKLISTSSADFNGGASIRQVLKKLLTDNGVPIMERTDDELYSMLLPESGGQEKMFIRLIATFVTLLKSSCKSVEDVVKKVDATNDVRSGFVIRNIFAPVYERYQQTLDEKGQIDFTDAILKATKICNDTHPEKYEYIIVDEFQDISIDRYKFLLSLRNGNPPAKLYCVGDDWQSIYRFSGSDMALFNEFSKYFGPTETNKIETTYRFGEPVIGLSSKFILRNSTQVPKNIQPFNEQLKTQLSFQGYTKESYCRIIEKIVSSIPEDKSIFLLGRYSFDDFFLTSVFDHIQKGDRCYYVINGRKIEFLTAHKSKGLEADYVIILQCNKGTYGFPSQINDDKSLQYVLSAGDNYPYGEERRLFYVAITRARLKTWVLFDGRFPSVFVDEFLNPGKSVEKNSAKHPNADKIWTRGEERFLLRLHEEGKGIKYISDKLGRSQTAIVMRLEKLASHSRIRL